MALVSVIVPAFNAERHIGQALASCLAQTLTDIEIIVIDDGSNDSTAAIVASITDPRLKLVRQANMGVSAARNAGLERAVGRFVQFLDADDVLAPEKLERQTAALAAAGERALSTSKWGRIYNDGREPLFVPAADWASMSPTSFLILQFGGGGTMPPNAWLMPRALIGDTRFQSCIDAFEDRVFLAQMAARAESVAYCGEAVSYYRSGSPNSLSAQWNIEVALRAYVAACLLTDIMLTMDRGQEMQRAVSNYWMSYAVATFPYSRDLAQVAERRAHVLGPPTFKPEIADNAFGAVARIAGWKRAALLRHWFRQSKLIANSTLKRA